MGADPLSPQRSITRLGRRPYPSNQERTLILALGNRMRSDDGVGGEVVASLSSRACLPASVVLLEGGTAGMKILPLIEGYDQVVIIDAADLGLKPGRWVRLSLNELRHHALHQQAENTLHGAGLIDALMIGDAMQILPRKISIYAVQPSNNHAGIGLSPEMRACIPVICDSIIAEINRSG
jgi:hydrogenase maturation protease